tara:strand:- start:549 stop:767 length:219 start_codon:yes stop_codon:yes gene_type:complete
MRKVKDIYENIGEDGDYCLININDPYNKVELIGVAGSTECFLDLDINKHIPKGKYFIVKFIDDFIQEKEENI